MRATCKYSESFFKAYTHNSLYFRKEFDLKSSDLDNREKQRIVTSGIVNQLNRILINTLGSDNFHLHELDVDIDPRHEAFWMVGGIIPPISTQKKRTGVNWLKKYEKDPIDRPFQYTGKIFNFFYDINSDYNQFL